MLAAVFEAGCLVASLGLGIILKNTEIDSCYKRKILSDIIQCQEQHLVTVTFTADVGIDDDKSESNGSPVVGVWKSDNEMTCDLTVIINGCQRVEIALFKLRNIVLVNAVVKKRKESESVGGPLIKLKFRSYPFCDHG